MGTPRPQHMRWTGGDDFRGPPLARRLRQWRAWQWLVAVNVAAFVVQMIGGDGVTAAGAFTVAGGVFGLQLWRWVTTLFLHADPTHLLFNMLGLWVFGPVVENRLRTPRFLAFYFACGLGGVLGYLLLYRLRFLDVDAVSQLIGASGCVVGLVVAAAHLDPNRLYRLVLPPVTLRLVTIAWGVIGFALLTIASRGTNAGGEAAHLGGAAVGFALIRNPAWFAALRIGPKPKRFWRPGDPTTDFFRRD